VRNKYQRKERKVQSQVRSGARARVAGAGTVADGRDASAGRRADRASRTADPARHLGQRSHAPSRTTASAESYRRLCALGKAAGLCGFCGTENSSGTAASTNAGRPGSGTGELRSVAAGSKITALVLNCSVEDSVVRSDSRGFGVHAAVVGTHAYVVLSATLCQSGSRPGILTFTLAKQVNEWKVESQAWARLS
jgi:hypothetical protein